MPKTPDEIKKGLECCKEDECFGDRENCPYTADPKLCVGVMCADALALIQQLQAENTEKDARIQQLEADKQQLEGMLTHMNQLRDAAAGRALKMEERVHQLEAELEDMTARYKIADDCAKKKGEMNEMLYAELTAVKAERDAAVEDMHGRCPSCKHYDKDPKEEPCASCSSGYGNMDNWQWRGVQKEDGNA